MPRLSSSRWTPSPCGNTPSQLPFLSPFGWLRSASREYHRELGGSRAKPTYLHQPQLLSTVYYNAGITCRLTACCLLLWVEISKVSPKARNVVEDKLITAIKDNDLNTRFARSHTHTATVLQ